MKKSALSTIIVLCALFVGSTALAGDVRGDRIANGRAYPGTLVSVKDIILRGEVEAQIYVRGDGDGDIDCVLMDEKGGVVDYDNDSTDTCYLKVTPAWTGEFTVRILNNGSVYSNFTLTVE